MINRAFCWRNLRHNNSSAFLTSSSILTTTNPHPPPPPPVLWICQQINFLWLLVQFLLHDNQFSGCWVWVWSGGVSVLVHTHKLPQQWMVVYILLYYWQRTKRDILLLDLWIQKHTPSTAKRGSLHWTHMLLWCICFTVPQSTTMSSWDTTLVNHLHHSHRRWQQLRVDALSTYTGRFVLRVGVLCATNELNKKSINALSHCKLLIKYRGV